ncbi:DUF2961 domain-containing protein [bacterium]|nr:MAG: DUF2961 domain-containing protein [bacterium]
MLSSFTLALAAMTPQGSTVSVGSLLREMTDLRALSQRSDPWFDYRQASSYDRNSDNWKDPFANGDAGQFIRKEGDEHVMADLKGPGAAVRVWSANPYGVIRFYFDGEKTPRLQGKMAEMLSGRNPLFPDPYAYVASQGQTLYFPLPYAKGLKVTWDPAGEKGGGIYYVVGHRDYKPGTKIRTFDTAQVASERKTMREVAAGLLNPIFPTPSSFAAAVGEIAPGFNRAAQFQQKGGGEVRDFFVKIDHRDDPSKPWTDPTRLHNILRNLRLTMTFDGEKTVDVPLGDFFGTPLGNNPYRSLPMEVRPDGMLIARWVMPYRKQADINVRNGNPFAVRMALGAQNTRQTWTDDSYLFHATWHSQTKPTEPRYDFNYLDAKGDGKVVGVGLQISNPVPEWWGEGDEKVYVDGETWPRLFGTGTEDYFGYAWCDPTPFERPYHAQPPTPNIGNFGQTENLRFHILDPIPFDKSIRFDMEAWHWKNAMTTYATTAYWYAAPGSTGLKPIDEGQLAIMETPLPKPIEGAIEGESLQWTTSAGVKEIQRGFPNLSSLAQLWWRNAPVGATASTSVQVPAAGRYEVVAQLGHARDYGRFEVKIGDGEARTLDFFQPMLEWKTVSLGTVEVKQAGAVPITFKVLTPNAQADPSNMLGVDYFVLKPAGN